MDFLCVCVCMYWNRESEMNQEGDFSLFPFSLAVLYWKEVGGGRQQSRTPFCGFCPFTFGAVSHAHVQSSIGVRALIQGLLIRHPGRLIITSSSVLVLTHWSRFFSPKNKCLVWSLDTIPILRRVYLFRAIVRQWLWCCCKRKLSVYVGLDFVLLFVTQRLIYFVFSFPIVTHTSIYQCILWIDVSKNGWHGGG